MWNILTWVFTFFVCSLYNNVLQPSKLIAGADFHCFKAGIEPKWEDPKCAHGGKWTAQPPRSGGKAALDTYWLHTVIPLLLLKPLCFESSLFVVHMTVMSTIYLLHDVVINSMVCSGDFAAIPWCFATLHLISCTL